MLNFTFSPAASGLDLSIMGLKGVEVGFDKSAVEIKRFFNIPSDPERSVPGNVKLLYIKGDEGALIDRIKKGLPVTGLRTYEVIVRQLLMTLTRKKDINAVLEFEAEPLIPFPIDEAILEKKIYTSGKDGSRVAIFAARKEHILHHLETCNALDIDPEILSCTPEALTLFSKQYANTDQSHLVLHIGWEETSCVLVKQGAISASYSVQKGLWNALEDYAAQNEKEPFQAVEPFLQLSYFSLSKHFQQLILDIKKMIFSLSKQSKDEAARQLLILGEGTLIQGLKEEIIDQSGKELITIELPNESQLLEYALPIGLALSSNPENIDPVDFRKKEFSYPHPLKRLIKPLSFLAVSSILAALSLMVYSDFSISRQEQNVREQYLELLATLGYNYNEFEAVWKKKNPGTIEKPLAELTQEDLLDRVNLLESQVKAIPEIFPLLPNVPKAADVLSWLASLPQIAEKEGQEPKIKLESFNYKMVKYPNQSKPQEKYQAKVDLEFTASSPRAARELHDALLLPNDMIDPSGEVKWSADRERYKASFTLKDKTTYSIPSR